MSFHEKDFVDFTVEVLIDMVDLRRHHWEQFRVINKVLFPRLRGTTDKGEMGRKVRGTPTPPEDRTT